MRLDEIHVDYHGHLNSLLWDGMELKPVVRKKLLDIAEFFKETLDIDGLVVNDIILTGSSANYNWTKYSDIDVHLVVDIDSVSDEPKITKELFSSKKKIWNDMHDITIYGYDVELYVQDSNEQHASSAVYSLMDDKWLKKPEHNVPDIDYDVVERKLEDWTNRIEQLKYKGCGSVDKIDSMRTRLTKMRKSGLEAHGEFSPENIVFKELRRSGHIKMLYNALIRAQDDCYSLELDENNIGNSHRHMTRI